MRTIVPLFLIAVFMCFPAHADDITVAAASDFNYALKDLASRFEKKTGEKVTFSFGSSGNLYSQIQSGAPYDLFFSADIAYPQKLAAQGWSRVLRCAPMPSVTGALGSPIALIWIPRS